MTTEKENKSSRGPLLYIILVLILLLINGLLFYSTWQNKERTEELGRQKEMADQEKIRLNDEIDDYLLRLDQYQSDNETLVGIRDSLKQVVLSKQKEIQKSLHEKNFTIKKLDEVKLLLASARAEIDGLILIKDNYIFQLDSVAIAYEVLRTEYDTLNQRYTRQVGQTKNVREARDNLESLGSILQAVNVVGVGVRAKKNGEEIDAPRAKRAERLQVCFELLPNRIIIPGAQTLYLKIVGPTGTTIALEAAGSGVFIDKENGEESMYTNKYTFDFDNVSPETFCVYWSQSAFGPGMYEAELYHQGYHIGESSFELK
ncbi:MAG: hypothetical protein ACI959_001614 [Limisphaerales bacterium]|jgi:hypothetical protein